MSALIKGMEMPTSCGYCPLMHGTHKGDECYVGAHITEYQKRPDDCPLVPVPPHGDLIESWDIDFVLVEKRFADEFVGQFVTTLDKINAMPVIIPADEEG